MIKKFFIGFFILLVIIVAGFFGFVQTSYNKKYNTEFPITELKVPMDSSMIERGRYLAQGPAHCIDCHSPHDETPANPANNGERPMSGGFGLEIPPGKFYAPNITPDMETGIGKYSDGELYRMLRHNIRPDGRASIDFMPFINMADEDIYAIIAYLRTQEKVRNQMPDRELTFLGKMVFAFGAIKPGEPDRPVLKTVKQDTTPEYGKYLAYSVANCRGCHTQRNMETGEYVGEEYAGGMNFGPDVLTQGWIFTSPNLTPEEETGAMAGWDEEDFIARIKAGRIYETSPMPWEAFKRITDNDLRAIYRYLKTLKPVHNSINRVATPLDNN